MQFPQPAPLGKRVPVFGRKVGRTFRKARNEAKKEAEKDKLSPPPVILAIRPGVLH